jgi:hypothetical protein
VRPNTHETVRSTSKTAIETLEGRRLMSAAAYDVQNVLDRFDGDAKADMAVLAADAVTLHYDIGDPFTVTRSVSLAGIPGRVDRLAAGDFNGDGTADLLTAGTYGRGTADARGIIGVLIGLAKDGQDPGPAFGDPIITEVSLPAAQGQPVVGDWNGDGRDDIGFARPGGLGTLLSQAGAQGEHVGFTGGVFVALRERVRGRVAAGDLNGDGRDDLAYVGARSRRVHVVENRGLNSRWDDVGVLYLMTFSDVLVSNVTDNGTDDLVVFRGGRAHVFEGDPQRLLGAVVNTSPINLTLKGLANAVLADVDGDGNVDLFSAGRGGRRYLALGDGDGSFTEVTGLE